MLTFFYTPFFFVTFMIFGLVKAINFSEDYFSTNLPALKTPELPSSIPTEDPITLIGDLSPKCQAAFLSIVTNPEFFECVPITSLLSFLTDPTLLPSILKDPIKNLPKILPLFDATCALPKCSDKFVNSSLSTLKAGCSGTKDASNPIEQLFEGAVTLYSPVRDIICFKDNKQDYCLVNSIENILGLRSLQAIIFSNPIILCTPCNRAIINTIINFFNANPEAYDILAKAANIGEQDMELIEKFLAVKCGQQFENSKIGNFTAAPCDCSF